MIKKNENNKYIFAKNSSEDLKGDEIFSKNKPI